MKKKVAALLNGFVGALTLRWGMYALAVVLSFFTPKVHSTLVAIQDALCKNEVLYKGVEFMLNTLFGIPGVIVMVLILLGTLLCFVIIGKLKIASMEFSLTVKKMWKVNKKKHEPQVSKERYFIREIDCVGGKFTENCINIGEDKSITIRIDGCIQYGLDTANMEKVTLVSDDKKQEIILESGKPKKFCDEKVTLIYCPICVE